MEKFKVGDAVRIRKDSKYRGQFTGVGIITEKQQDGLLDFIVKIDGEYSNSYNTEDLELVGEKAPEQKELIVHCPTQELFNKVQMKMLEIYDWIDGVHRL